MRQRVLLAEESDNIRKVAESALRQKGYELIAVTSGDKVLEVLEFTRPDLIVVSSELKGRGNKHIYEFIKENPRVSNIPLLILCNPDETGLPFPEEFIIPKPLDTNEFVAKVNAYVSSSQQNNPSNTSNLVGADDFDDEMIDAALGLDNLNITESEDLNKTNIFSKKKEKPVEKMIGFDHQDKTEITNLSGKVESLVIQDENFNIQNSSAPPKPPEKNLSSTSGLEILDDQYGLVEPDQSLIEPVDQNHDYNWFLNELKKEGQEGLDAGRNQQHLHSDSQKLQFEDPSSLVDPVPKVTPGNESSSKKSEGVDKFIDEFKKEVEKIDIDTPDSITIPETAGTSADDKQNMKWEESFEKLTQQKIELFSKKFITELADKVSAKIAEKIDSEKLHTLIKNEIIKRIEQNK